MKNPGRRAAAQRLPLFSLIAVGIGIVVTALVAVVWVAAVEFSGPRSISPPPTGVAVTAPSSGPVDMPSQAPASAPGPTISTWAGTPAPSTSLPEPTAETVPTPAVPTTPLEAIESLRCGDVLPVDLENRYRAQLCGFDGILRCVSSDRITMGPAWDRYCAAVDRPRPEPWPDPTGAGPGVPGAAPGSEPASHGPPHPGAE